MASAVLQLFRVLSSLAAIIRLQGLLPPRTQEDFSLWHGVQLACIKGPEAARIGSEEQFQLLLQRAHCVFVTGSEE